MTEAVACKVKGCAWRGPTTSCPWHSGEYDAAWDRQWELLPETFSSKKSTRHRAS